MSTPVQLNMNLAIEDETPGPRAELLDPSVTVKFMLAGNAHVTFQSKRTDARFTYRIRRASQGPLSGRAVHFVAVLTRPDYYEYLGCIFEDGSYHHGTKSHVSPNAPSAAAFYWTWQHLSAGRMPKTLAVYHEGRCGKCGRRLTDPTSITTGLGPICAGRS